MRKPPATLRNSRQAVGGRYMKQAKGVGARFRKRALHNQSQKRDGEVNSPLQARKAGCGLRSGRAEAAPLHWGKMESAKTGD